MVRFPKFAVIELGILHSAVSLELRWKEFCLFVWSSKISISPKSNSFTYLLDNLFVNYSLQFCFLTSWQDTTEKEVKTFVVVVLIVQSETCIKITVPRWYLLAGVSASTKWILF